MLSCHLMKVSVTHVLILKQCFQTVFCWSGSPAQSGVAGSNFYLCQKMPGAQLKLFVSIESIIILRASPPLHLARLVAAKKAHMVVASNLRCKVRCFFLKWDETVCHLHCWEASCVTVTDVQPWEVIYMCWKISGIHLVHVLERWYTDLLLKKLSQFKRTLGTEPFPASIWGVVPGKTNRSNDRPGGNSLSPPTHHFRLHAWRQASTGCVGHFRLGLARPGQNKLITAAKMKWLSLLHSGLVLSRFTCHTVWTSNFFRCCTFSLQWVKTRHAGFNLAISKHG